MKRERAKELLPIIQAYAEGKKLQYKVVGYEDWHDVDDEDGINEGTRYEYRIKPEANYIATVDKLEALILEKKKFLFDQGLENKLKIKLSISEDMEDHLIDRYCMRWLVPKTPLPGSVKTFMGIEYEVGEETKVEVVEKKSKAKGRPFKSCDELIETWKNMMNKVLGVNESFIKTDLDEPTVWVKQKIDGRRRMIVGFGENFVEVGVKAKTVTLERLFEMYTFLDGTPIGVEE